MAEITYPFDRTVPAEAPLVIAPDVVWLRMPLPYVLNHVNIWLIKDSDGWCAVDTGATCAVRIRIMPEWPAGWKKRQVLPLDDAWRISVCACTFEPVGKLFGRRDGTSFPYARTG